MSAKNKSGRFTWLRYGRLLCQTIALALTVLGYFAFIRGFGMPKWMFAATVLLSGLFFCGWVCPFGTIQEWLRSFGKNVLGITWKIPTHINRYLLFSRYVFTALGLVAIVSSLDARKTLVMALSGRIAGAAAIAVLAGLLLLSLFVDRPYCKFLCGFGALFGLASMVRFFAVKRNAAACAGCGRCDASCMMGVEVSLANNVRDPNCINCGKCVAACPVPGALGIGFAPPCKADVAALAKKYNLAGPRSASRDADTQVIERAE